MQSRSPWLSQEELQEERTNKKKRRKKREGEDWSTEGETDDEHIPGGDVSQGEEGSAKGEEQVEETDDPTLGGFIVGENKGVKKRERKEVEEALYTVNEENSEAQQDGPSSSSSSSSSNGQEGNNTDTSFEFKEWGAENTVTIAEALQESTKRRLCVSLIRHIIHDEKKKVVIFSESVRMLKLIRWVLNEQDKERWEKLSGETIAEDIPDSMTSFSSSCSSSSSSISSSKSALSLNQKRALLRKELISTFLLHGATPVRKFCAKRYI